MDDLLDGRQRQALGGMHQELAGVGDGEPDALAAPAGPELEGQIYFIIE